MNPIRAFRSAFSSDSAYHAREYARRALRLVEQARTIVGDKDEHAIVVTCSTRNGTMTIEGLDFLEALITLAQSRKDEASAIAFEERIMKVRRDAS